MHLQDNLHIVLILGAVLWEISTSYIDKSISWQFFHYQFAKICHFDRQPRLQNHMVDSSRHLSVCSSIHNLHKTVAAKAGTRSITPNNPADNDMGKQDAKPAITKGYRGLSNEGATCYLNTVLQTLFMTKEFREAVLQSHKENHAISSQLNQLFQQLMSANKHASTQEIRDTLGIRNVHEQKDAAEYFHKILNMVKPEMSKVFQGRMQHSVTCLNQCSQSIVEFKQTFFIAVPMGPSRVNVQDSVDSHFQPTTMCGENQLYCETCQKMTDMEKKYSMVDYPQVLVLHLQRISLDYSKMTYVKNKATAEIPFTLSLEGRKYDLYAIVNHSGSFRSGHYYADIKSFEDQKWYQFNDSSVTKTGDLPSTRHRNPLKFDSERACLLLYKENKEVHNIMEKSATCGNVASLHEHGLKQKSDQKQRGTVWMVDSPGTVATPAHITTQTKPRQQRTKHKGCLTDLLCVTRSKTNH